MPNYYAHLQFGDQVLDALPEDLRTRLEVERDAYTLGQYGPDPLFFSFFPGGRRARVMGHGSHRKPVSAALERLRCAVQTGVPFSTGYAAGYLCHFALDGSCHQTIHQWFGTVQPAHTRAESELDRLLMLRSGLDPNRDMPMLTPEMPEEFDRMLEGYAFPGIKGKRYREGMRIFRQVASLQTKLTGSSLLGRGMDTAIWASGKKTPRLLEEEHTHPDAACQACSRELLQVLESQVPEAARQLTIFLRNEPLGPWFHRDFYGKEA
jgi:hypothetical protein